MSTEELDEIVKDEEVVDEEIEVIYRAGADQYKRKRQ